MSTKLTPLSMIESAFSRFESTVTTEDARQFHSTTLADVRQVALNIEKSQRKAGSLRHMRRIEPFLQALEIFAKPLDVLCNGTPFLPWIWAPIKLMLQLAVQANRIFDTLLNAYARIGEALPRFDRYSKTFEWDDFQNALALVYVDIIDFHRRAYKFFRRRAWQVLFESLWNNFENRFEAILNRLREHCDLVDREAVSFDIVESSQNRRRIDEELDESERQRKASRLQAVLSWLAVDSRLQEDDLWRLSAKRFPFTCEWLFDTPQCKTWMEDNGERPILWLWGIPGSGKSVICSFVVQALRTRKESTVLHYFYNYKNYSSNDYSHLLRTLTTQLLRSDVDLAMLVWDLYVCKADTCSIDNLSKLLPNLIAASSESVRIIVDGLDEAQRREWKYVLDFLEFICADSAGHCKVFIASRDEDIISRRLRSRLNISLNDEASAIGDDIRDFVEGRLSDVILEWDLQMSPDLQLRLCSELICRSKGMFLWVELVIGLFQYLTTEEEMLDALEKLPSTLQEAYDRIVDKIFATIPESNTRRKIMNLLSWTTYAQRSLRVDELLSAISIDGVFQGSKLPPVPKLRLLDLCKPLLELSKDNTVDFFHFSAKEYFQDKSTKHSIDGNAAQLLITKSCLSYLITTTVYLNKMDRTLRIPQIIRGERAIHRYAITNWLTHLEIYSVIQHEAALPCSPEIETSLEELCWVRKPNQPEFILPQEIAAQKAVLTRHWQHNPDISQLLHSVLAFKSQSKSAVSDADDLQGNLGGVDPTSLSLIKDQHENDVAFILELSSTDLFPSVDQATLSLFREANGNAVFFCRFEDCVASNNGFKTLQAKQKHELSHSIKLYCDVPDCTWEGAGFRRPADLRRHKDIYHAELELSSISEISSIPRKSRRNRTSNEPKFPQPPPQYSKPTTNETVLSSATLSKEDVDSGNSPSGRIIETQSRETASGNEHRPDGKVDEETNPKLTSTEDHIDWTACEETRRHPNDPSTTVQALKATEISSVNDRMNESELEFSPKNTLLCRQEVTTHAVGLEFNQEQIQGPKHGKHKVEAATTNMSCPPSNKVMTEGQSKYIDMVKESVPTCVFEDFLNIVEDFRAHLTNCDRILVRLVTLFSGVPQMKEMVLGFNDFMPPGFHIKDSPVIDGFVIHTSQDIDLLAIEFKGGKVTTRSVFRDPFESYCRRGRGKSY